jgi:hypothetical protein
MDGSKPWYLSNTVWASVLQLALGVAVSLGVIDGVQSDAILADGPELIVGIAASALGLWGLIGRVRATKTLTNVTDGDSGPQPY